MIELAAYKKIFLADSLHLLAALSWPQSNAIFELINLVLYQ
jgi:hypothetical protein